MAEEELRNLNRIPWVPGHITSCSCSRWDHKARLKHQGRSNDGKRTVTGSWKLYKCWSSHGLAGTLSSADGQSWAPMMGLVSYEKRKTRRFLSLSCAHNSRKVAICTSGRGPHQEPNPLAPWSWTPQPPRLWKVNVCCSSYWVCSILLWWPELTETSLGPLFLPPL